MRYVVPLLPLLFSSLLFAQGAPVLPELDDKDTYALDLQPDADEPLVRVAYMQGTTVAGDTLRFTARELGYELLPVVVTVVTGPDSPPVSIDFAKPSWDDVVRSTHTRNGAVQDIFRTTGEFGILLYAGKEAVPFQLAVWVGAATKQPLSMMVAATHYTAAAPPAAPPAPAPASAPASAPEASTWWLPIIAVALGGIFMLLLVVVLRRRNGPTVSLIGFLLVSGAALPAQAFSSVMENLGKAMEIIEGTGQGLQGSGLRFRPSDLADPATLTDMGHYVDILSKTDEAMDAGQDPAATPSLPSSCLSAVSGEADVAPPPYSQRNDPAQQRAHRSRRNRTELDPNKFAGEPDLKQVVKDEDRIPKNGPDLHGYNKDKDGYKPDVYVNDPSKTRPTNDRETNRPAPPPPGPDAGEPQDSNQDGCQCLAAAYAKLENNRYYFRKLDGIYRTTKQLKDNSIALGDNTSGIHAVSGMAWQVQRANILKSYAEFEQAYRDQYKNLTKDLHDTLMEIDRCEKLLGFENWYGIAGFIYYDFMKARYQI